MPHAPKAFLQVTGRYRNTHLVYITLQGAMRNLEEFSTRRLTYDSDAMNAIAGALNVLSIRPFKHSQRIYHIWGIPLICTLKETWACTDGHDSHKIVDTPCQIWHSTIALRWLHIVPARRRQGFPSWSPLGWVGQVQFRFGCIRPDIVDDQLCTPKEGQTHNLYIQSPLELFVRTPTGVRNESPTLACTGTSNTSHFLEITIPAIQVMLTNVVWLPNESSKFSPYRQNGVHIRLPMRRIPCVHVGSETSLCHDVDAYIPVRWDEPIEDSSLATEEAKELPGMVFAKDSWLAIILLEPHGSYYERIGYASISVDVSIRGFTNGGTSHGPMFTVSDWQLLDFEDFAWLRHVEHRKLILG